MSAMVPQVMANAVLMAKTRAHLSDPCGLGVPIILPPAARVVEMRRFVVVSGPLPWQALAARAVVGRYWD